MGVILFELLTGERPFRAERDQKLLMQQILNADPPPPSQLNSQVPADLDTLCLKCLEKDPSRRFPTAAALAQELHRFLHGEPIHSRPITQWERARKWCQRNPAVAWAWLYHPESFPLRPAAQPRAGGCGNFLGRIRDREIRVVSLVTLGARVAQV